MHFILWALFGNWFSIGGIALIAIAGAVFAFLRGWLSIAMGLGVFAAVHIYTSAIYQAGVNHCEAQREKDRLAFIQQVKMADTLDALQRQKDLAQLAAREREVERLKNELENPDNVCFNGPDADRLRQLWR